jgi:hypothetical protein
MGGQWPRNDAIPVIDLGGTLRVYAVGNNGNLYERSLPAGGGWSDWFDLGGVWPGDAAVTVDQSGTVRIYAIGSTTDVYEKNLPKGGNWSGWADFGHP